MRYPVGARLGEHPRRGDAQQLGGLFGVDQRARGGHVPCPRCSVVRKPKVRRAGRRRAGGAVALETRSGSGSQRRRRPAAPMTVKVRAGGPGRVRSSPVLGREGSSGPSSEPLSPLRADDRVDRAAGRPAAARRAGDRRAGLPDSLGRVRKSLCRLRRRRARACSSRERSPKYRAEGSPRRAAVCAHSWASPAANSNASAPRGSGGSQPAATRASCAASSARATATASSASGEGLRDAWSSSIDCRRTRPARTSAAAFRRRARRTTAAAFRRRASTDFEGRRAVVGVLSFPVARVGGVSWCRVSFVRLGKARARCGRLRPDGSARTGLTGTGAPQKSARARSGHHPEAGSSRTKSLTRRHRGA